MIKPKISGRITSRPSVFIPGPRSTAIPSNAPRSATDTGGGWSEHMCLSCSVIRHGLCSVSMMEVPAGTNGFDEPRQQEISHCQPVLPWPDERSVLYGAEEASTRITQNGRVSTVFQTRRAG